MSGGFRAARRKHAGRLVAAVSTARVTAGVVLLVGGLLGVGAAAAGERDAGGGGRARSDGQGPASSLTSDDTWNREFVPGQVLVGFQPGLGKAARASVVEEQGATFEDRLPSLPGVQLVEVGRGASVREAVASFERQPEVRYAEPNFIYHPTTTPNDPEFGKLWGLHNTGQTVNGTAGTPDADIDAPEAWDLATGSESVQVAVVDSGISYDHPDLSPNMWTNPGETGGGKETNGVDDDGNGFIDDWRGWDFGPPLELSDNDPFDTEGHGTHVAGTIGARGNDATGVAGVAWQVELMNLRVCGFFGCANADISSAFAYAGNNGADVVNASLGGPSFSTTMQDAITNAPDTLFVAAAGNGGGDGVGDDNDVAPSYPCNYPNANLICVAASDQNDDLTTFSNFGATSVDLAAPGQNILSTYNYETVLFDNFETDIAGRWTHGGTNDSWERTTEVFASPIHSLADSPFADYQNDTDSWARPNALGGSGTLADVQHPLLNDTQCTNSFCTTGDQLRLEYSTDGGDTWANATRYLGQAGGLSWSFSSGHRPGFYNGRVRVTFPGSPPTVPCSGTSLRLRFTSDSSGTDDGVYLDNFRVRCYTSRYEFLNGTSMATPHVAGAAALLLSEYPAATVADIRNGLLGSVDSKASLAGKVATGGRLNVHQALLALDTDPPETTVDSWPPAGPTTFPAGDGPQAVAVGDFNGDGDADLAVANNGSGTFGFDSTLSILLGTAGGNFTAPTNIPIGGALADVAVGDFNADGDPDLVLVPWPYNKISILLGTAGAGFTGPTDFGTAQLAGPQSVAVGEFNGDGDPDLAVVNRQTFLGASGSTVSIFLGASGGTFTGPTDFPVGRWPNSVAVGDFNGDGDPDLAVANSEAGDISILLGAEGGTFTGPTNFPGVESWSLDVGDFNGDGDPDLAVADWPMSDSVSILLGGSGGTFGAPTSYPAGDSAWSVAVGAFDGDGDPDLAVVNPTSDSVSILLGGSGGTFGAPATFAVGDDPRAVAVGEFNGDGRSDIAVGNEDADSVSIRPGDGNGSFSAFTNDPTPEFTFGSDEAGATFQCHVDTGAFAPCTSPHVTGVLTDGTHTFEVKATDAVGNVDATPASLSFTVDTANPTDPTVDSPSHDVNVPSNDVTVDVTWSGAADTGGAGVDGFSYVWDTSPSTTPDTVKDAEEDGTGTTSPALSDGASHWFHLRTRDNAGNWTSTVHLGPFVIDTDPPETTITEGPDGPTNDPTPEFTFSSDDGGSTFACRVDAAPFASCTSPHTTASLSDGAHTFEVQATDAVGNTDASPASRSFTVDTVAPSSSVESGPTGPTNDPTPTFGFTATDPGGGPVTVHCRMDEEPYGACSGPGNTHTSDTLNDGAHIFSIRATDQVGYVSTDSRSFTVDTVNPTDPTTLSSSSHITGVASKDPTVEVTWSGASDAGSGVDGFSFVWDTSDSTIPDDVKDAEQDATGTISPTLVDGSSHWFHLRTRDNAGNWTSTVHLGPFVIDTDPPETTITGGPEGLTGDPTPEFTFSSDEPGSTFACRVDADPFASCTSPHTTASLTEGPHTFEVQATDAVGNTDASPASRSFTVEIVHPKCGDPGVICGTSDAETLTGTAGADLIFGGGGDDVCKGLGGNDTVVCGPGNDRIVGGGGNDKLKSTSGSDVIKGGSGKDVLRGGGGADTLAGGGGNDKLFGQGGKDLLNGGAGSDLCSGGPGKDTLRRCEVRR